MGEKTRFHPLTNPRIYNEVFFGPFKILSVIVFEGREMIKLQLMSFHV